MKKKGAGQLVRVILPLLALVVLPAASLSAKPAKTRVSIVKEQGVWWFKDAGGKRFFSLGSCCLGGCYGHWEDKPMEPARRDWMVGLMNKWGFNTAAAWSSPSTWNNMYIAEQIYPPFSPKDLDVFDSKEWNNPGLVKGLKAEISAMKGRPNLIGYFIDNERQWEPWQSFRQYRRMKPGSVGARTLVDFTRKFYKGDLKALNREWGAKFAGFSDITGKAGKAIQPQKLPGGFLSAWRNEVAGTYYRSYAGVVRRLDPGCLILGERHAGQPDADFLRVLAPSFDVFTINDYNRYGTLGRSYARFYEIAGKPMMITEWSFSGWPRPGFESLQFIDVYSQENRAKGYRKYVLEAAKTPFMVGMHWFLWSDYGPWKEAAASLERPEMVDEEDDQEAHYPDQNMGLVSHDEKEVYEVLVAECARTNAEVDGVHAASAGWKQAPDVPLEKREVGRISPVIDGSLVEWSRSASVAPVVSESLDPSPPVSHTYYLGWTPAGLSVAGDISDGHLDFPGKDWAWEGDYLSLMVEFSRSGGGASSVYFQVYPVGEGEDGKQPYAVAWWGIGDGEQVQVAVKLKPGGYTMEAFFPPESMPGVPLNGGASMKVYLGYRDVSGIYETQWSGEVVLK